MASVNKASLREEFAALKGQFERLCAEGQVTGETHALVQALLMLFELLMAVFMEKHTPKSSRNSSLPPSQTGKEDDTATRPGTQAKDQGHAHSRSGNTRTVETVTILPVDACAHCGAELSDLPPKGHERRTRIDIIFETVLSHLDAEVKDCPHCHTQTKAAFPSEFSGPVQYGPGIRAYVLNLLVAQMVSLKRVQQSIHTLIGRLPSEATLLNYLMQLHLALRPGSRRPSRSCSRSPHCMWTRPPCGSIAKTIGSTSTRPGTPPSSASIPNGGAKPLRPSASSPAIKALPSMTAGPPISPTITSTTACAARICCVS
jgi:transposase